MDSSSSTDVRSVLKVSPLSSTTTLSTRSRSRWTVSRHSVEPLLAPEDAGLVVHRGGQLLAHLPRALAALRGRRWPGCGASWSRTADSGTSAPLRFATASSAACRPARRPKTIVSISELPPSRFAPCTETQAHLAGGVQAGQDRLAVDVAVDSAHVVVGARPDGDRLSMASTPA